MNFFWLLGLHWLADYAFQSEWMIKNKRTEFHILVAHVGIWTLCISIGLVLLDIFSYEKMIILFFGHLFIDTVKCQYTNKILTNTEWCLETEKCYDRCWCKNSHKTIMNITYIDQLAHVCQLLGVYFL